jgi:deferrochelatase/peroxidase EfeB
MEQQGDSRGFLSRRGLFAGTGAGVVVGAAAGFAGGRAAASEPAAVTGTGDEVDLSQSYPFYAATSTTAQAGIKTLPQRHTVFMTFDIVDGTTTQQLQTLLARWSAGIAQLMAGKPVGQVQPVSDQGVADDTGEALDLGPASLTVTLGLGPGLFDERFGLAAKRPALLRKLPALPSDSIRPELDGGDLSLQACADDPQVAYHAIRDLARLGRGTVTTKWTVMGFGRASAGKGQSTPRNLLGFKDGTRNITEDADFSSFVWTGADAAPGGWMAGGSYQVVRKIEMNIEIWDADRVSDQERIFGRGKQVGEPLTGSQEFDTPDFTATKAGAPVIDPQSHIALAAHENNDGIKILRRGYNYTDGINDLGHLDAGLLFVAYMNDPGHFVQLQTRLGGSDLLNEYISHIGSAVFAVPPAPQQGHYLAEQLFS